MSGRHVCAFDGHDSWVRSVRFHPHGQVLLSVSDDKSVRVWPLASRRCMRTIEQAHTQFVSCLTFHAKFPLMATGSVDAAVALWQCVTGLMVV